MNYDACLEFLYSKLPMFSRIGPAALKNDLTNTLKICQFLENPQTKFKTIHIAGTNGKGSVSHMLASIFQTAGFKTGLYTSPHLYDFRERIRINGEMISKEYVTSFTEKIIPLIDEIEPSFFEATVGMAFDYFHAENVDIAIIETGLGGRLDSTNVIRPELSIITNIGLDHTHLLGNTLLEIAGEKAGIIKERVPVIIGAANSITRPLFEKRASELNSKIIFSEDVFKSSFSFENRGLISIELINKENNESTAYSSDLPGVYQAENIRTVKTAIESLQHMGWKISEEAFTNGVRSAKKNTGLYGRWDIISYKPMIILDVAHNADGMRMVLSQIKLLKFNKLHFILGLSGDKDVASLLIQLPIDANYYFTHASIPRALNAKSLKTSAMEFDLQGDVFENVNDAIENALTKSQSDDLLIVCGSIFVVSEVDRQRFLNN